VSLDEADEPGFASDTPVGRSASGRIVPPVS
jgi:hypothetical protein